MREDQQNRHHRRMSGSSVAFRASMVVLTLTATQACTSVAEQDGVRGNAPSVSVHWREKCDKPAADDYFQIDVSVDGWVHYVGGKHAREVGERRAHIGKAAAWRVIGAAKKYADATSRRALREHRADTRPRANYCMEVSGLAGSLASSSGSGNESRAFALRRVLDDAVRVQRWVCPLRASYELFPFGPTICPQALVLTIKIADPKACGSYHSIYLFGDGILHYSATRVTPTGPASVNREYLGDSYVSLDAEGVHRLMSLAVASTVVGEVDIESFSPVPRVVRTVRLRGTAEEIQSLKTEAIRLSGLEEIVIAPFEGACRADPKIGAGSFIGITDE
jgi:hypothetical protein